MKEETQQESVYSLEEIDKEAVVVCTSCGILFDQETASACPHCQGKGGNPDEVNPEEEVGLFGGLFDEP